MSENLEAFATFRNQLQGQNQHSNGDESFCGRLIYNFRGQSLQETLNITLKLTTFEYGQISIEDGDILNSEIVHMDFNPNFQDYSFSNEGFLIIRGRSGRIGNYEAKITQV
jgi:hypothetical protein